MTHDPTLPPHDIPRARGGGSKSDPSSWKHPGVREVLRDETLWVLDKPAGVLSHPNPPRRSAAGALLRGGYDFDGECYRLPHPGGEETRVYLVHRLDRETSGLILCTFDAGSAARLKAELRRRGVQKEYRALVLGSPRRADEMWTDRLEKRAGRGRVSVMVRPGRREPARGAGAAGAGRGASWRRGEARTRSTVLERLRGATLLALRPATGRTHQLRVQASARGLPIAGDDVYGDFQANRFLARAIGLGRMYLHALRLAFPHPRDGRPITVRAELPAALEEALRRLRALRTTIPRRGR
jgi:23S rRNA-/tRNA-specific pseudouridylate synthase